VVLEGHVQVDETLWTQIKIEFFRRDEPIPNIFGRQVWVFGLMEEISY
jgi:hypothetical protein